MKEKIKFNGFKSQEQYEKVLAIAKKANDNCDQYERETLAVYYDQDEHFIMVWLDTYCIEVYPYGVELVTEESYVDMGIMETAFYLGQQATYGVFNFVWED